jgi:hypothetical protein
MWARAALAALSSSLVFLPMISAIYGGLSVSPITPRSDGFEKIFCIVGAEAQNVQETRFMGLPERVSVFNSAANIQSSNPSDDFLSFFEGKGNPTPRSATRGHENSRSENQEIGSSMLIGRLFGRLYHYAWSRLDTHSAFHLRDIDRDWLER